MIKLIVVHKIRVCATVRVHVLSEFGILHYEGLVVRCGLSEAAKPWSLRTLSDCLRACERERERVREIESVRERMSAPAVVMFGLM